MSRSKRHHYIPEFYLQNFVDQNSGDRQKLLHRYERGKDHIVALSPKDASVIKNYYLFQMDDGSKNTRLEKFLSELEDRIAPIILKTSVPAAFLTDEELSRLLYFAAFMYTRVPRFRDNIEKFLGRTERVIVKMLGVHAENWFPKMKMEDRELSELTDEEVRKFALDDSNYEIRVHPNESIKAMLHGVSTLFKILSTMRWGIVRAVEDIGFFTSDSPVVPDIPGEQTGMPVGFGMENVEVSFPLTPKLCMFGGWRIKNATAFPIPVPCDFVVNINDRTIDAAYKYVYASY